MKSHLAAAILLILNNTFTNGQLCGFPVNDKFIDCIIWDNYKVKTFQSEFISFNSNCGHTLLDFQIDGDPIRINLANNDIHIVAKGGEYELKKTATKQIQFKREGRIYSLPTKHDIVEIIKPGRFAVARFSSIGLEIKWDGEYIIIQLDNQRNYEGLAGLCFKNCGGNVTTFAEQWKTSTSCSVQNPNLCNTKPIISLASAYCHRLLRDWRYHKCFKHTDVVSFLNVCQQTYCSCKTMHYDDCMCDFMDAYIKHCEGKLGQVINWRRKGFCEKKCKNPQQHYVQCSFQQRACGTPFTQIHKGCIEGCTCPLNLWLSEDKCIPEEKCPCRYENSIYEPGSSIVQECKTCVCINNNQWKCPSTMCYGEAVVSGDPHYTTFDGKRFDFMGKCSYYLVKGLDFAIIADHYVFENGRFVKNFKSGAPSYTNAVEIKFGEDVLTLNPKSVTTFNGKELKRFPHKESNITINKFPSGNLIVELPNYVEVHWDGANFAKIRVPETLKGYIQGLMGNYNKNPNDDFMLPDGSQVDNANSFGHGWKVDGSCFEENTDPSPHPCETAPSHRSFAEKACSALKGHLFKDCKNYNVEQSYESCVYDCCLAVEMGEKCACEILTTHARRCSNATTQWRKQVPACNIECPAGQEYSYCLNPCENSCDYIRLNPNCQKQCLEGCSCPEGQTFDENKKCIPIEKCKCMLNGKYFPVGYTFLSNNNIKKCVKGKWENSLVNDIDNKKYDSLDDLELKCSDKPNSVYTACKAGSPISCENMDKYNEVISDNCESGCECIEGFVLHTTNETCVQPEECPCFFNGKSYDELAERNTLNGKCTCKSSSWECTRNENALEKCNIFGTTNIRNLSGKIISFETSCEYILAHGQANNNSYTITVKSGDINIAYTIDDKEVQLTINKGGITFPSKGDIIDFDITKILEIREIDLKLVWSKDGVYSLQFKPEVAEKLQGLCGKLENADNTTNLNNLETLMLPWNKDQLCFELNIPKTTILYDLDGTPTPTKCDILKSDTFSSCANHLLVDEYYSKCVMTAHNLMSKRDAESLETFYCQIFSGFSLECADVGNPIQWRTPGICPLKCSNQTTYNHCVSTCSCDDIEKLGKCPDKSCFEGCFSEQCSQGSVFVNNYYRKCTTVDKCKYMKCLENLEGYEDSCKCEDDQMDCELTSTPTAFVTEPTTMTVADISASILSTHILFIILQEPTTEEPVTEPENITPQGELLDTFNDVNILLENSNEPLIYDNLSPKDKQMIEAFTNYMETFQDEINCYTNMEEKSMCKCRDGVEICGLTKNKQTEVQNELDIKNNLMLIKFMQTHLRCLDGLKENSLNCTCISGRKICSESLVTEPSSPAYSHITECERRVITAFFILRFANERLNCLLHLPKDPLKNCRCEKGYMICRLQSKDNAIKQKEIPEDIYRSYIDDAKKHLQCETKIANRQEICSCKKGQENCVETPKPISQDNDYVIVEKYKNTLVNKSQVYNTFEKGIKCTEELDGKGKVCTCLSGERECFETDSLTA